MDKDRKDMEKNILTDYTEDIFSQRENDEYHISVRYERELMDAVKCGDVERLKKISLKKYKGNVGRLSDDPIKNFRYFAICCVTLFTRAAMKGGVSPENAFALSDACIRKLDKSTTEEDIQKSMDYAKEKFGQLVSDNNSKKGNSKILEKIKRYIFKHLHKKISVEEMALELGMNKEYLSHIFHKLEGKTIVNYIQQEKIIEGENLLKYSEHEVATISSYLGFSSQSYFNTVFKKYTGMTPAKYRAVHQREIY
ncbi:AraC family transcriptional regulator [Fusobacterium ulcerans]|uniref:AraC family transcriptional regulator n=1 Tax=Fusobacterium ulcerans TaxID=861 RepID=UPI00241F924B|nr:AraC family transcriptional regulator [Fusobacterium ulcerans]